MDPQRINKRQTRLGVVLDEVRAWQERPLEAIYPIVWLGDRLPIAERQTPKKSIVCCPHCQTPMRFVGVSFRKRPDG